jgi:hypothetical protein
MMSRIINGCAVAGAPSTTMPVPPYYQRLLPSAFGLHFPCEARQNEVPYY